MMAENVLSVLVATNLVAVLVTLRGWALFFNRHKPLANKSPSQVLSDSNGSIAEFKPRAFARNRLLNRIRISHKSLEYAKLLLSYCSLVELRHKHTICTAVRGKRRRLTVIRMLVTARLRSQGNRAGQILMSFDRW